MNPRIAELHAAMKDQHFFRGMPLTLAPAVTRTQKIAIVTPASLGASP